MGQVLRCTIWFGLMAVAGAAHATHRYQVLMDLDADPQTGCQVAMVAGTVHGVELRSTALPDAPSEPTTVDSELCSDDLWQPFAASASMTDTSAAEPDVVAWAIPRSWLGLHPRPAVHISAKNAESGDFDVLGEASESASLLLPLGEAAQPVPAFGALAWLLCCAVLIAMARRYWPGRRRRPEVSILAAVLLMAWASVHEGAQAQWLSTLAVLDPADDQSGVDPAVDLLSAHLTVKAERVEFRLQVRDLDPEPPTAALNVLFVGNSLTYSNDLPLMVRAIAAQAGKNLQVNSVTMGGANLEDLYRDGAALTEIARGHYQWVILQQGTSALPASQEDLRHWAVQFNTPIRASGARPALYMVWPELARIGVFDAVRMSYSNAALAVDGMFIPAGETWRSAWRRLPSLPLYDSDDFHPSTTGSYAAALSIYCELFDESPVGLPASLSLDNGRELQFTPSVAELLQASAWSTHLEFGRSGH